MTVRKDLLSGTPEDVARKIEDLSCGLALHEYVAGTRLRGLAVELAKRANLQVSLVTYEDQSQELEVLLAGDPCRDAIMIDRDNAGDLCQLTWDRWLAIRNDYEIEKTADLIAATLGLCADHDRDEKAS